ncbi:MAG: hypothetical protein M4D80_28300 [Myxococcota bacterium]|nr:hypothetical protein [Myxococcota bacterium]
MTRLSTIIAIVLAACGAPASPPTSPATPPLVSPSAPVTGAQGVSGTVERVEGDFMPPLPENYRGTVTPLSCRVFVFAGKIKSDTPIDEKHPSLRALVKSDAAGRFTVALDPGTYTIVAELDGKLYLNSFDGYGFWNTITVEPHKFVDYKIADTSRATY